MSLGPRPVSRVRSGAAHHSALATTWQVRVTGIEFINDFPMEANGDNRSNTDPDRQRYTTIPENFRGWGRGAPLTGWDWEGADNLERAACYRRFAPVNMRVRLRSSLPAPTARTFNLEATPSVDGDASVLTAAVVPVSWPAGQQEQIVTVMLGGVLPNGVSRYHLRLTWSVSLLTPGGRIGVTNHKIFGVYADPLDPDVSSATGSPQAPVTGLTKKRLDKLTRIIGGPNRTCPTPSQADINRLSWNLHVACNDETPPWFNGARPEFIKYGSGGPRVELVDQWVMWLASRTWSRPNEHAHWNAGSCIGHVQLMKTMLAGAGINSRRAWVIPKTTLLPNGTTRVITASDLIAYDNLDLAAREQAWTFTVGGVSYRAAVLLIDKPTPGGWTAEQFEACLHYDGKLVPGAIATSKYPPAVLSGRVGFSNALEVLRWWHSVAHGSFQRFMCWLAVSPGYAFFDRNGTSYGSPYDIPASLQLPVP